jgi:hypothetical protein
LKYLLVALSLVVAVPAYAAADYRCYTQYKRLLHTNPNTLLYSMNYDRYMNECAGQERDPRRGVYGRCYELRKSCLNKEQLGEQGEGNCRQYRQTCRGQ